MMTLQLTVTLPDKIAVVARARGLLLPESLASLIQKEIERQVRIDRLFETADQLSMLEPPLTPEEIDNEIRAVRRARRR